MSCGRRIGVALCVLLPVIGILLISVWPKGPTYQGRTVEEWFEGYHTLRNTRSLQPRTGELAVAESAFEALGTNAVPYLAARITQDPNYSTLEMWRINYRRRIPQVIQSVW